MPIPILIVLLVFLLIAVRQIGRFRLHIWQIMCFGALTVLAMGQITPRQALAAIDADVMLFLFGMFIIGHALEDSGFLEQLSYRIFRRAKNPDSLLLCIIFGMGILSAFLMNDTLAIIGTPVVLLLAKRHRISPNLFLLALAFAVTTGSVMSPIGNPQNFLIALRSGIPNPFLMFFVHLFIPTIISLLLVFAILRLAYHPHFGKRELIHGAPPKIADPNLALLSQISLALILLLVVAEIAISLTNHGGILSMTAIALIAAAPILIFSEKRLSILRKVDWHTLIFFAAMFVLMESVWKTGFFQSLTERFTPNAASVPSVFLVSVLLSQLISNVPLVAMYLPILQQSGVAAHAALALAAGSTIAGNLLILGAASNVIIIQNAEKKGGETISFLEFAKVGIPLTVLQIAVYVIFLSF